MLHMTEDQEHKIEGLQRHEDYFFAATFIFRRIGPAIPSYFFTRSYSASRCRRRCCHPTTFICESSRSTPIICSSRSYSIRRNEKAITHLLRTHKRLPRRIVGLVKKPNRHKTRYRMPKKREKKTAENSRDTAGTNVWRRRESI